MTYSVKYFRVIEDDPDSFVPDILIEPTLAEYINSIDPVLEMILKK